MTQPIKDGFSEEDDEKVAHELQHFINCDTCQELMYYIRRSPYDDIIVDLTSSVMVSVCMDFGDR